jgi:hypothetical protein
LPCRNALTLACPPAVLTSSPARAPLGSVGLQPIKNLLFIVRICFPRFCFWTDILRPLVSFLSPLQAVGILCVCLYLVVFLLYLVLYRVDVFVHSLCMIPKDALLFVRYRSCIYRSESSALVLPRMVHVLEVDHFLR